MKKCKKRYATVVFDKVCRDILNASYTDGNSWVYLSLTNYAQTFLSSK